MKGIITVKFTHKIERQTDDVFGIKPDCIAIYLNTNNFKTNVISPLPVHEYLTKVKNRKIQDHLNLTNLNLWNLTIQQKENVKSPISH